MFFNLRPGTTLSPALQIVVDQSDRPIIAVALRGFIKFKRSYRTNMQFKYKLRKVPGQAERAIFYPLLAQALDEQEWKPGDPALRAVVQRGP